MMSLMTKPMFAICSSCAAQPQLFWVVPSSMGAEFKVNIGMSLAWWYHGFLSMVLFMVFSGLEASRPAVACIIFVVTSTPA